MKKALALILATAMACSLLLTGCGGGGAASGSGSAADGSAKQSLTLGTGGTTGTYYAVGGVMSTVLNDKLSLSSLTVTSTGASKANIQLIADGEADLAIVQNDVMYYANTGTDLFEAEGKYDSFSAVCGMYDETVQLITTDAGTGFMHESFSRHDAADFTRAWFAWQNTLFGELILKLVNDGKTDLLNSIR